MNQKTISGLVLVVGLVACGVGWMALPSLQASQRTVNAQASVELEKARRLLHQYNHGLTFKSIMLADLDELNVDVDMDDPSALLDGREDDYQRGHESSWEAYQPVDYGQLPEDPRKAKARYGNLERQIADGISGRNALINGNDRLLDDALSVVESAIRVSAGDASARDHGEANRLKGVILLHQGLAEQMAANDLRRRAAPNRRELKSLSARVARLTAVPDEHRYTDIDAQIAKLESLISTADEGLEEKREALGHREEKISELESRLSDARQRAKHTRGTLDSLRRKGVDLSDPDGAAGFESKLTALADDYRRQQREIAALEFGSYADGHIDQSGDYLNGEYVSEGSDELVVDHGLNHYRRLHSVLNLEVTNEEQARDAIQSVLDSFADSKQFIATEMERDRAEVERIRERASEVYDDLNRLEAEAFDAEDKALTVFDQSQRATEVALRAMDAMIRDGQDSSRQLSAESRSRSAHEFQGKNGWVSGHVGSQVADAQLAKAWIHCNRYRAYRHGAGVLKDVAESLTLGEADPQAETEKSDAAHAAAVQEVEQAVARLERAHRDGDRHWTFVAQEAGATYLMVLLGHPQYLSDSLEAYRAAVENRETEPFTQKFVARTNALKRR